MNIKRMLTLTTFWILTLTHTVFAQSIFDRALRPFQGFNILTTYERMSTSIDFIIVFAIFYAVARFAFKDKYGDKSNVLAVALSIALAGGFLIFLRNTAKVPHLFGMLGNFMGLLMLAVIGMFIYFGFITRGQSMGLEYVFMFVMAFLAVAKTYMPEVFAKVIPQTGVLKDIYDFGVAMAIIIALYAAIRMVLGSFRSLSTYFYRPKPPRDAAGSDSIEYRDNPQHLRQARESAEDAEHARSALQRESAALANEQQRTAELESEVAHERERADREAELVDHVLTIQENADALIEEEIKDLEKTITALENFGHKREAIEEISGQVLNLNHKNKAVQEMILALDPAIAELDALEVEQIKAAQFAGRTFQEIRAEADALLQRMHDAHVETRFDENAQKKRIEAINSRLDKVGAYIQDEINKVKNGIEPKLRELKETERNFMQSLVEARNSLVASSDPNVVKTYAVEKFKTCLAFKEQQHAIFKELTELSKRLKKEILEELRTEASLSKKLSEAQDKIEKLREKVHDVEAAAGGSP